MYAHTHMHTVSHTDTLAHTQTYSHTLINGCVFRSNMCVQYSAYMFSDQHVRSVLIVSYSCFSKCLITYLSLNPQTSSISNALSALVA